MPKPARPKTHLPKRSKKRSRSGRVVWGDEEVMGVHRSENLVLANGSFLSVDFYGCFEHGGQVRQQVLTLKYSGQRSLARELAQPLGDVLRTRSDIDVVTWAPTSLLRRQERGFDHGELLARHAAISGHRKCQQLLRRVNDEHQTGKSREVRLSQPRFISRPLSKNRRICVIDDVMTTGATLRAAAQALANVGAQYVLCLSVTYVSDWYDDHSRSVKARACAIADVASCST